MLLSLRLWTGHGAETPRYTQGSKFIAGRKPGTKRQPRASDTPREAPPLVPPLAPPKVRPRTGAAPAIPEAPGARRNGAL